MMRTLALTTFVVATACGSDPFDAAPLGDYTGWKRIDTYGKTPGHGDSYRIIYVNDLAETYAESDGRYPEGSIFVKEVYQRDGDQPGALNVIELMRNVGPTSDDDGGWQFSAASTVGGEESGKTFCWRRCHQAAPFQGAWFDYSK